MPAPETVLAELRAAQSPGVDPRVREDYLRLIEQVPSALFRDGLARAPGGGSLHLTTSAVVVDRMLESLVLVHHRRAGLWVQPGGHVEQEDASLEAAARREVLEETGLSQLERLGPGPALLVPHDEESTFGTCGGHWDVVFLLRVPGDAEAAPLRAEDGSGAQWCRWDDAGLPAGTAADIPGLLQELEPLRQSIRREGLEGV